MSMEQNGKQDLPSSTLCRNGCGFYAHASFDGMCSKCYKDTVQRQQGTSPVGSPVASSVASASLGGLGDSVAEDKVMNSMAVSLAQTNLDVNTNSSPNGSDKVGASGGSELNTASPTVSVGNLADKDGTPGSADKEKEGQAAEEDDKGKKPKRNRCLVCKKKVGLTGFDCRCGGLFCGIHRYSDKHDCTFDYREHGQEQIRKNNPVVVGSKVQKI